MTRLPVISGKKAVKALKRAGFVMVRQRGSHVRMKKATSERMISITIPLHDGLDRGTLKTIINRAGLSLEEFVEMLQRHLSLWFYFWFLLMGTAYNG